MNRKKALISLILFMAAIMGCTNIWGQQVRYFRYEQDGVQAITTIAPVNRAPDMRIIDPEPQEPQEPQEQPPKKENSFNAIIEKYANYYSLDPSLIHSIIETESGFNPKAVSPKGARGLMQLMPATAERLGVQNSFDPEENIKGGVKHFRSLMDNFNNDLELSLAAYNAGENLVQRLGRVPNIRETQDYVQTITARYGKKVAINQEEEEEEEEKHPPAYRFFDESGVLHLTNIPPVR